MDLVARRLLVELFDPVAERTLLHLQPLVEPGIGIRRGLSRERQLNPSGSQDLVGGMEEVEHPGHAEVGDRLIDDLLDLDRRDADVEGPAEHDAVFVDRLAGNDGGQLHHEAGPRVQGRIARHVAERPVVEDLDQLGVGRFQRRLMIGEQRVVVALRFFTDGHGQSFSYPVICRREPRGAADSDPLAPRCG